MNKDNEIKAYIKPVVIDGKNKFFVLVKIYKFDTIRQETYWTVKNKLCKTFKTKQKAEAYITRILKEHGVNNETTK